MNKAFDWICVLQCLQTYKNIKNIPHVGSPQQNPEKSKKFSLLTHEILYPYYKILL